MPDLNWREIGIFLPMLGLVFWMGLYPASFLNVINPAVDKLVGDYHHRLAATSSQHAEAP